MPTGEEKKPLLCRLENDKWVAIGHVEPVYEIGTDETYGIDFDFAGLSFDDTTVEIVLDCKAAKQAAFHMMGVDVVNIIFCKDCVHRGDRDKCPMSVYSHGDTDFCSKGERK